MNEQRCGLRLLFVAGIVTVAVVSYVVLDPGPHPTPSYSPKQPSSVPSQQDSRPQNSRQGAPSILGAPSESPRRETMRVPEPSVDEKTVRVRTLQKIRELLGNAEFKEAKILDERTHSNKIHDKMIEVPPPSQQFVQEAYEELSRALKAFPSDSPLAEKLQTEGFQAIAEFADRPKPYKVVQVQLRDKDEIYIVEYFVDDLKTVARDSEGRISFRLGSGYGDAVIRDDFLKEGDGWAYERYSHFFEEVP